MPSLGSSTYQTVETILNRARMILNDSEVVGGDVLTDTAPFTFDVVNGAYEKVQADLATYGIETYVTDWWLIGLPIMPIVDPEARLIIDDTGTNVVYPNGVGNVFSLTPQLPVDLVVPLRVWERQNGTTNILGPPMWQPNGGLCSRQQQNCLGEWEWKADGLRFRGALQSQDIKIMGEKSLPKLSAPTDPVPIRGVTNAAAYYMAKIFTESRGGAVAEVFANDAKEEIFSIQSTSVRRRQRKQVRRRPYSGGGGRRSLPI